VALSATVDNNNNNNNNNRGVGFMDFKGGEEKDRVVFKGGEEEEKNKVVFKGRKGKGEEEEAEDITIAA
jgi:hypothetical protein